MSMECPLCKGTIENLVCNSNVKKVGFLAVNTDDLIVEKSVTDFKDIEYVCPICRGVIALTRHDANLFVVSQAIKNMACPFCCAKDKTKNYEYDVSFIAENTEKKVSEELYRIGYYVALCTKCGEKVYAIGCDGIG